MLKKLFSIFKRQSSRIERCAFFCSSLLLAPGVSAQFVERRPSSAAPAPAADNSLFYLAFAGLVAVLLGWLWWLWRTRDEEPETSDATPPRPARRPPQQKSAVERPAPNAVKVVDAPPETDFEVVENTAAPVTAPVSEPSIPPIFDLAELAAGPAGEPLPASGDEKVLRAAAVAQDELEENAKARAGAVAALTGERCREAAEALASVALYDVAASLRAKAVAALAEFDHETVFETILLAGADPSREVRAAAARGLFRLSFDRADAWLRLAEMRDPYRRRLAARAALDADLVARSFDRLVHHDAKIAREAAALSALMIRAGETEALLEALQYHRQPLVKLALLRVAGLCPDERLIGKLAALADENRLEEPVRIELERLLGERRLIPA